MTNKEIDEVKKMLRDNLRFSIIMTTFAMISGIVIGTLSTWAAITYG